MISDVHDNAADARALLLDIRRRLLARTATREDFRPALEAMLCLPLSEAERWLDEFLRRFAFVHATADPRKRGRNGVSHREACEGACDEPHTNIGGGAARAPDPVRADGPTAVISREHR